MNYLLLSICTAVMVVVSGCGGGETPEAVGTPLATAAYPAAAEDMCSKGRNDTATVSYVSVDAVCTKMFAPMAKLLVAGDPPMNAAVTESAAIPIPRVAHAPFTWATLLSWAAANYPQFFRGSYQDGVLGEYTYRYWPTTGHYIGLRNSEQLYVLGPATDDEILYIGTLSALLCFVYPDNCTAGTGGTTGPTTGGTDILGNASTTAAVVSTSPYSSAIDIQGDEDWFAVDLVAGSAYTFNLEGAPNGKGTLADPYLKLFSSTSQLMVYNDDVAYPSNLNSRLTYTPATSGRYYVSVSGYSSVGTYQLTVSVIGGSPGTDSGGTPNGSSVQLTTSRAGQGEGTVTPASANYTPGTRVTVTAQPEFFSEFVGWTSNSAACVGIPLGCELIINTDSHMEARFDPVVFVSAFDSFYTSISTGKCEWGISWTNTRLELSYAKSGDQYLGRLRVMGTRRATVSRTLSGTCRGSSTSLDQTFSVGAWGGVGSGVDVRVRTFDGEGDEYLTLTTGGLPGPALSAVVGDFIPVQVLLQYTGTGRSGQTQLLPILTRLVR